MKAIDICYTPLGTTVPPVDVEHLVQWVHTTNQQRFSKGEVLNSTVASSDAERTLTSANTYPWKKVDIYNYLQGGWQFDFNTIFPRLSDYFPVPFGLDIADVHTVSLLPTVDTLSGFSFWHRDRDDYGFRMYLDNENHEENPLYYKKTVIPYTTLQSFGTEINVNDPRFQPEMHICKMLGRSQAFYLNNLRGMHSFAINRPARRFAVVVSMHYNNPLVFNKMQDLIIKSALTYKDHAIFY